MKVTVTQSLLVYGFYFVFLFFSSALFSSSFPSALAISPDLQSECALVQPRVTSIPAIVGDLHLRSRNSKVLFFSIRAPFSPADRLYKQCALCLRNCYNHGSHRYVRRDPMFTPDVFFLLSQDPFGPAHCRPTHRLTVGCLPRRNQRAL